jgi:hypothetical protein
MDDYPKHLTPPKDTRGNVDQGKFGEWWVWAREHFPNVPENVAHRWIHENWGGSPYSYLKSKNYEFEAVAWPSDRLFDLRSEWGSFDPTLAENISSGRYMCHNTELGEIGRLAAYVMANSKFPHPIVMLDNQDGHLEREYEDADRVPTGIILIEGHARLNIGVYLHSVGRFAPTFDAWLMKKIPAVKLGSSSAP